MSKIKLALLPVAALALAAMAALAGCGSAAPTSSHGVPPSARPAATVNTAAPAAPQVPSARQLKCARLAHVFVKATVIYEKNKGTGNGNVAAALALKAHHLMHGARCPASAYSQAASEIVSKLAAYYASQG
jgi:hypothetical protein